MQAPGVDLMLLMFALALGACMGWFCFSPNGPSRGIEEVGLYTIPGNSWLGMVLGSLHWVFFFIPMPLLWISSIFVVLQTFTLRSGESLQNLKARMAELQREVAWKERELLRQALPVCQLFYSFTLTGGRVVENLLRLTGIFLMREGKQEHVSNTMFQDPTGSGETCCAGVPPLPTSLAPAHKSSDVGLRRRPPRFLSPLKLGSPKGFESKAITRAKEEPQVNPPWVRLPLLTRSPTSTLACHTLGGVLVASPPREAPKRQARVEGMSRLWGESFLHSPTIYCFANRCETHYPSHNPYFDSAKTLGEEDSPALSEKDFSSPDTLPWEGCAFPLASSQKETQEKQHDFLPPRYMVAEVCSPSHEGDHAPVSPTAKSLSATCTSSGEIIAETFPETVPFIEIYPQPQEHAEGRPTHIRMFRARPSIPAPPPAEGQLVPTSPEEGRESFTFPALPPAEGQLVPTSPEGGRASFTPEVVDSGDEEEEEQASLPSPASPPRSLYSVPQFPEEIMDIDLTHVYLVSDEGVPPEVAQTRQAIAKIRTRLQSAFAQQKQITEVLEQWFGKIRSLATYTESIAEAVRGQGDGLFKLRDMTHSALQDQTMEFSAKYDWINLQLEELKSSLQATFKEVRRLVPDELPTKLQVLEDKLDNLQQQFHNWSQNPPSIPAMPEEATTRFRQLDERLASLQAQLTNLSAHPKVVVQPSLTEGPSVADLQNRVKHLESIINESAIGETVAGIFRKGVNDLLTQHVIPQVEQKIKAIPVLQVLQQREDHLASQLAELTLRLSQLEELSPQAGEPPQQFEAAHPPPQGAQGPRGLHGVPSSSSSVALPMLGLSLPLPPRVLSPSKGAKEKWAGGPHVALPEAIGYDGAEQGQGFAPPPAPQGGPASGSVTRTPWKEPSGQSLGPQAVPTQEVGSHPQVRGAKKQPWRMGLEVEGGSRFGSEADRESTILRSNLPDVAIQAVSQVASNVLTPLVTEAMRNLPRFSGQSESFGEWKERWERALRIIVASNGQALPSAYVLELLYSKLDEASQKELNMRMKQDPYLEYATYYAELCQNFEIDSKLLPRNRWRKVTLDQVNNRVTLPQWRRFRINLSQALEQGDPPSDADLREHILQQLPSVLREMVLREERHTRKRQYWVKVTSPVGLDLDVLLEKFTDALGPNFNFRSAQLSMTPTGFLLECGSERARTKALLLSGLVHEDYPGQVKVDSVSASLLGATSILELLDELIHAEDEIRLANPVPSPPTVLPEVEVQSRESQQRPPSKKPARETQAQVQVLQQGKGKGKGKGAARNPSPPKKTGGRSAPKAKDKTTDAPSPKPKPSQNGECYTCKNMGLEYMHNHWSCPNWLKRGTKPKKEQKRDPNKCWVCEQESKPCEHEFWTCPAWQERQRKKLTQASAQSSNKEATEKEPPPAPARNVSPKRTPKK